MAAVETARKLEAVELAQKCLYRERRLDSDQLMTAALRRDSVQDMLDRL